jgi:hypothetical protein
MIERRFWMLSAWVTLLLCVSPPSKALVTRGVVDTPGKATAVAMAGTIAYVADGDAGLRIIDISDLENPREVSTFEIGGYAWDVEVADGIAYLAAGLMGLRIIDVSDPHDPTELGAVPGASAWVEINGGLVYLIANDRLNVIDVTAPKRPVIVGSIFIGDARGDFAVANGFAYIPRNIFAPNLWLINVSDPSNPVFSGLVPVGSSQQAINTIEARGRLLYVGSNGDFLGDAPTIRVMDVSIPTSPVEIGAVDTQSSAQRMALAGDILYFAGEAGGMGVINVSDPMSPKQVGALDTPDIATDVEAAGSVALIADQDSGLRVIDVTRIATPREIATLMMPGDPGNSEPTAIDIENGIAYVTDPAVGLQTIDVTDPFAPTALSTLVIDARDVVVVGQYAYVAAWFDGLRVIDVSNPADPVEVAHIATSDRATDIAIVGTVAYVAAVAVDVIDISDPTQPTRISSFETLGFTDQLAASDGLIVAIERASVGSGSLRLIDVSDPNNPIGVSAYETQDVPHTVEIENDIAYVTEGDGGLELIDISDWSNPRTLGLLSVYPNTAAGIVDVTLADGIAFVADSLEGAHAIDVGDPRVPFDLGGIRLRSRATSGQNLSFNTRLIERSGSLVYAITSPEIALRVIDFGSEYEVATVNLDIKPGSDSNPIYRSGRGFVSVALFGDDEFDVGEIDVSTLTFGRGGAMPVHDLTDPETLAGHLRDLNEDGVTDLVTHFSIRDVEFLIGDTEACLTGRLLDKTRFKGCDVVSVFGKRRLPPRRDEMIGESTQK